VRRKQPLAGSLADQAYLKIRERILKGELPLGAALPRRELAEHFGMSFLPISEAIQRLEFEGLVETRPRVGTRVRVPSAQDIRDRYVIREALEVQSARLFAEKASADERRELRAMAAKLDALTESCGGPENDSDQAFQAQTFHISFHTRIAECSGCQALVEGLEKNQVLIFNWLYDAAVGHRTPPNWHQQLIEALTQSDPDIAGSAMRRHVRYGLEEIQAGIAELYGTTVSVLATEQSGLLPHRQAWRRRMPARS
jgi:DNA-binding GntR family transcriptional regulator